ncbi:MAG: hypothetical protein ACYSWO_29265 [Planctomycetota bacterium]|jgi:hypothetical protein
MGGLADFMQGPGGAIAPAVMGGLAGASGNPGAVMGANTMMGGLQQMFEQQQKQKLGAELAKAFTPPPQSADADSANRSGVSHDAQMEQYRIINALLQGGDIDRALKQYTGLSQMMQPKYGSIPPGHSSFNESTGEIGDQAAGTFKVQGNTGVHTTMGIGGTTDYGDDLIAAKVAETARKAGVDANNLAIDEAQLGISQQRADSYSSTQESVAAKNEAQTKLANAKAVAEEANEGRPLAPSIIVEMLKQTSGLEGKIMQRDNPKKYNQILAQLRHAGIAIGEAQAQNKVGNEDPDSTKEGLSDPQYDRPTAATSKATPEFRNEIFNSLDRRGGPTLQGGDYLFNPTTNSINPR